MRGVGWDRGSQGPLSSWPAVIRVKEAQRMKGRGRREVRRQQWGGAGGGCGGGWGGGGGGMGPLLPGSSLPRARCDQGEGSTENEGEEKERGQAGGKGKKGDGCSRVEQQRSKPQ